VVEKIWQKVAIGKFATFLTPLKASSTKICLQVKSFHYHVITLTQHCAHRLKKYPEEVCIKNTPPHTLKQIFDFKLEKLIKNLQLS
jgi:hypothetical protein